jgi:1,2-dihydroxy-3-keto-5-methylthiopentene dioxygenase
MSYLKIYTVESNDEVALISEFHDFKKIKAALAEIQVNFESWQCNHNLENFSDAEILEFYQEDIKRIKQLNDFQAVDIVNLTPDFAADFKFTETRAKFNAEHTHADDEARYFISGKSLFTINQADQVYEILCEAGDFINVPANYKHWFDFGSEPDFKALRFFKDAQGWVPHYTGSGMELKFQRLP